MVRNRPIKSGNLAVRCSFARIKSHDKSGDQKKSNDAKPQIPNADGSADLQQTKKRFLFRHPLFKGKSSLNLSEFCWALLPGRFIVKLNREMSRLESSHVRDADCFVVHVGKCWG